MDPENIANGSETGAFIYGLFAEACRFDTGNMILEES